MHPTRNRTSSAGLQTGTTPRAKIVRPPLAFQILATRVVRQGDQRGRVLRPLAAAPRVLLRTSMSRTSLLFPWLITRPRLPVVAGLSEEEHLDAAATLSSQGVLKEVVVVVLHLGGDNPSVVVGEAGEIGRRYTRSLWFITPGIADMVWFSADQSYSGIFCRYFTSVDDAGGNRVPSLGQAQIGRGRGRRHVSDLSYTSSAVIEILSSKSDTYGRVFAYDKSYDRVTTKTERPLQLVDRIKYNTTTSDDPVIQQVHMGLIFSH